LQELILSQNKIKTRGVELLVEYVEKYKTLNTLHISFNSIDLKGALMLSELIKTNSSLEVLSCMNNKWGTLGIEAIINAIPTSKMYELVIGNTDDFIIDDLNVDLSIGQMISKNPNLYKLVIFG
jgi:Ran GTPase-activating protein (RanGAP) involved in mRNA processing and transport